MFNLEGPNDPKPRKEDDLSYLLGIDPEDDSEDDDTRILEDSNDDESFDESVWRGREK